MAGILTALNITPGQARLAATKQREAIEIWRRWLDTGIGPNGGTLPNVARPHVERWIAEAIKAAADWDVLADRAEREAR